MNKLRWQDLLLFCLALNVMGCASNQYLLKYQGAQVNKTVWPQPPEKPRYEFIGFLSGETNFVLDKKSQSYLNKGLDWIAELVAGKSAPRNLYRPQGVFFDDASQRLFVSDVGLKSVFVFDLANKHLQVWDQADELTHFVSPIGIAVTGKNEVLVSDSQLGFVSRLDAKGKYLGTIGKDVLQRPTGIAVDAKTQKIYVADAGLHQVVMFDAQGKKLGSIGGQKSEQGGHFNAPTYLVIDQDKLIVSDTLNARVQFFDLQGRWLESFGERGMKVGNITRPKGIAVDTQHNIYVIESYYDHLLVFNAKGEALMAIGGRGRGIGQFDMPTGMWVDKQNRVFVADMFNSRISVFQFLSKSKEYHQSSGTE